VAAGELAQVERELVAAESTRPRDEAALASALQRAIELCRSEPAADDYFVLPELLGDLADTWEALGRPNDDIDDPERLVGQLADLRLASLAAVGSEPDDLQATAEAFLAQPRRRQARDVVPRVTFEGDPAAFAGQAVTEIAWAWFPASEYAEALRRWPELTEPGGPAAGGRSHGEYCRAMESRLRAAADAGMTGIQIAPLHLDDFSACCETQDADPAGARAGYAAELARLRDPRLVSWPPARNGLCWCGSRRKKKCCGTPGSASG